MARANRHVIPGQIWHLTHRCHEQKWLLRFARDRRRWLYWLFEARKRYGLLVLNYVVTCNHVHLLVKDQGFGEIARSMQLIAARTAQEYNKRKSRRGAFWEDRYHSTAVQTEDHLQRCITYIDLNMVRAGAVEHPKDWVHGGYAELQMPVHRYKRVNYQVLLQLLEMKTMEQLQQSREYWLMNEMNRGPLYRQPEWTDAIAVGSETYIEAMLLQMNHRQLTRKLRALKECCVLRESQNAYDAFLLKKTSSKR